MSRLLSPLQTGRADFPHPASLTTFDESMRSGAASRVKAAAGRGVADARRTTHRREADRDADSDDAESESER